MSEYLSYIDLPDDCTPSPEHEDSFIEVLDKRFASLNFVSFEEICYFEI